MRNFSFRYVCCYSMTLAWLTESGTGSWNVGLCPQMQQTRNERFYLLPVTPGIGFQPWENCCSPDNQGTPWDIWILSSLSLLGWVTIWVYNLRDSRNILPLPFTFYTFLLFFLRCNTLQYLSFNNCVPYTIKDKIFTSILWEGQHYSQVKDPEMFWWAGYYSFLYSMWSCGIILQTIRQNRVIRPMGKAGKIWNLSVDRKCSCHFTRSKEWDTEFDSRNSNFSWS